MDLDRIADVETLRDLLRVQLKESERLKRELQEAYKQLRDKDESKAEQLALRLAQVERQHAAALKLAFGQGNANRSRGTVFRRNRSSRSSLFTTS